MRSFRGLAIVTVIHDSDRSSAGCSTPWPVGSSRGPG